MVRSPISSLFLKSAILRTFNCLAALPTDMFAVAQLASTNEKTRNLDKVVHLVAEAAEKGAKMVFLPECADFIATSREEALALAEDLDGTFFTTISKLAKQLNIWVSIGSMHRTSNSRSKDQRLLNTHVVLNDKGEVAGIYDKTHLFSIDLSLGSSSNENERRRVSFQESRYIQPGLTAPVVVYGTPVGDLGLAICYDLRFPELASALRYRGGANVLAYPAAFTSATGNAGHWHTLMRARAIENQCYVIAAAQSAFHNPKLTTYGHSMVVDPSGQIIAERVESGPGLLLAQLYHHPRPLCGVGEDGINYTDRVRTVLPVENSRRHDLFPLPDAGMPIPIGTDDFHFGPFVIKAGQVFYRTPVSMAFVNISPLVPGHVLVTPIEVIDRFTYLPIGTIADMYACVKRIAKKLSEHFNARSLTISMQDGEDAGQSVPHVHVHVLPRKPGDFARNDDIYDALQRHDKVANRKYRSYEEMAEEAKLFRSFFYDEEGLPLNAKEW
ncbi:Nitrilase and fragile histidine triad fusion protein NitFhit [Echinococcus granulosus]|uniref:bis(5'-adenosyl)-triphosphatase n=1 Tax=Echinococcus granulosus TaxID=6210 RepID=A0A068WU25_ECHGR|nr:Nitrilase and fragile histidine triad fusion protein NitFhit [Echinococcus granulosus]CDS23670.1 Nitrilase and fragile histidine triad fusion [Echinococcus granulosus]